MKILLSYLATRPLINIASLERAVGCSPRTIQNAMQHYKNPEKGRPLPDRWALPIIRALCADSGSIELVGWNIRADEMTLGFLLQQEIPNRPAKSKQIAAPDGGHYMEYSVPMYREYFDGPDFFHFLKQQHGTETAT